MRFKIDGIRGGKATKDFLALPPILQNRLLYLRYFGGAMVPAIRNRWSKRGLSGGYINVDPFNNTGGMWRGFTSRIVGKKVVLSFTKMSLSSRQLYRIYNEERKNKQETRADIVKRLRRAGKLKKINNRLKAKTSQEYTQYQIAQPSRDEVNCLVTWMEEHMEKNLTVNLRDVRAINKRAVPDRFNEILRRLPNPKNKR